MIGKTIFLGGYKFCLLVADDYTMKYMKDNSDIFPEAEIANIIEKIKRAASSFSSLQQFAIDLIKKLDPNGQEVIPFKDFIEGVKS